jgi:hypothetical protein
MISRFTKGIIAALMLFLALAIGNSIIYSFGDIINNIISVTQKKIYYVLFLVILIIGGIFINWFINMCLKLELKRHHFIVVVIMMFCIGFLNIVSSHVVLKGDPEQYFNAGLLISENFEKFNFGDIYHRRALFYTFPIFSLLPASLKSVQFVNLFFYLISGFILTNVLFKEFGKHIAFYFLVLYALSFEFYTAIAITSHDIASIFYFSLLTFLFFRLNISKSIYLQYVLIFCIAFFIVVNEFQRSIKIPLLISLLFLLLLSINSIKNLPKNLFARNIFCILLCTICLFHTVSLIKKSELKPISQEKRSHYGNENMIYSYNELNTNGNYLSGKENRYYYISQLFASEKRLLVTEKLLTQISTYPYDVFFLFHAKVTNLFLISPWSFAYLDMKFYQEKASKIWILNLIISLISLLVKIIWSLFAIKGLVNFIINRSNKGIFSIYAVYPLVFLPLFLLSEVNPSYALIIYPSIFFFAAVGLAKSFKKEEKVKKQHKLWVLNPMIIIIVSLFSIYILVKTIVALTPATLIDFNKNHYILSHAVKLEEGEKKPSNPFELYVNPSQKENEIPTLLIKQDKTVSKVSFFIKTKAIPSELMIKLNGQSIIPDSYKVSSPGEGDVLNYYYYFNDYLMSHSRNIELNFISLDQNFLVKDFLIQ